MRIDNFHDDSLFLEKDTPLHIEEAEDVLFKDDSSQENDYSDLYEDINLLETETLFNLRKIMMLYNTSRENITNSLVEKAYEELKSKIVNYTVNEENIALTFLANFSSIVQSILPGIDLTDKDIKQIQLLDKKKDIITELTNRKIELGSYYSDDEISTIISRITYTNYRTKWRRFHGTRG